MLILQQKPNAPLDFFSFYVFLKKGSPFPLSLQPQAWSLSPPFSPFAAYSEALYSEALQLQKHCGMVSCHTATAGPLWALPGSHCLQLRDVGTSNVSILSSTSEASGQDSRALLQPLSPLTQKTDLCIQEAHTQEGLAGCAEMAETQRKPLGMFKHPLSHTLSVSPNINLPPLLCQDALCQLDTQAPRIKLYFPASTQVYLVSHHCPIPKIVLYTVNTLKESLNRKEHTSLVRIVYLQTVSLCKKNHILKL